MSFVNIFTERASNYREVENMLEYGFLPLTKNVSNILGGGKRQEAFHTTSLEYLKGLKNIKGDKAISTFTKNLPSVIGSVNVKPDVLVKLEGNVVLDSDKDLFTHLDKSGMRWVNLRTVHNDKKKYDFIWDAFSKKTIKYMNDTYKLNIPQKDIDEKFIAEYFKILSSREKKDVVTFYINNVESLLTNSMYKDMIVSLLQGNKTDYKHNEIVLNKFKILKVFALETGRYQFSNHTAKEDIESLGYTYGGFIRKTDFSGINLQNT